MKRRLLAVAVLLLVAAPVMGQSAIGQQEDFEDDTVGQEPTAEWYVRTGAPTQTSTQQVFSPGLDGTDQGYRLSRVAGSYTSIFTFNDAAAFDTWGMFTSHTSGTGQSLVTLTGSGGNVATMRITAGGFVWEGGVFLFTAAECTIINVEHRYTFDWTAKSIDFEFYKDGALCSTASHAFASPSATAMTGIRFDSSQAHTVLIDQFQTDDGPLPMAEADEGSPSEFDAGFLAFFTGLGFISVQSQMFLAIILVGVTTVTVGVMVKFMASGRFKNWGILGAGVLVAVFVSLLGFIDLWMFIVSLMLGLFAMTGSQEARNTWGEIRDRLAARTTIVDDVPLESPQEPAADAGAMDVPPAVEAPAEAPAGDPRTFSEAESRTALSRLEAGQSATIRLDEGS